MRRAIPFLALLVVAASLTLTALALLRLLAFDGWTHAPPRLTAPAGADVGSCGGQRALATLAVGEAVWTSCGPSAGELQQGGALGRIDLAARRLRLRWPFPRDAALFGVEGLSVAPDGALAVAYRIGAVEHAHGGYSMGQVGLGVAIAGPEGWLRPPETLSADPGALAGLAWVDDAVELVLHERDPRRHGVGDLVRVRVPRSGATSRSTWPGAAVCGDLLVCGLRGAYHHPERGWRFALAGVARRAGSAASDGGAPATGWDVGPGEAPEPRRGLTDVRWQLDRSVVGLVGLAQNPAAAGAVLEPDGAWTPAPPPPPGVTAAQLVDGHYRWEGGRLERYRVWRADGPARHLHERGSSPTIVAVALPPPDERFPELTVSSPQGDHVLAIAIQGDEHLLAGGQIVSLGGGGYLLWNGQGPYLLLAESLAPRETRGAFTYLHEVRRTSVWPLYWVLFGLPPCLAVALLVTRRRRRRAAAVLAAALVHAVPAALALNELWPWLQ